MSEKFDLDKQIGQKIKEARLEFGYSQMNLADVLGFESPTAVSLIESGDRSLKIRDLIILCQLFMKDYDYFIGKPSKYKQIRI
jgi:transcriptional regulator with XRE-family HTH domain